MAESILWYQSPNVNEEDKLYVDGAQVDLKGNTNPYFLEFMNLAELTKEHPAPWCGFIDKTFVIKGFFKTKDDYGRKTAFLFGCNLSNYKEELNNILNSIGMELDSPSMEKLNHVINPHKKKVIFFVATVVIFLILIAIVYGTRQ